MKTTCCSSSPRCRQCPVVLKMQARARAGAAGEAALVEEILIGGTTDLPACVIHALDSLSAARDRVRSLTCSPSVSLTP